MLQAQLDKAIHVYRVQFETEFRVLSEIWARLAALRAVMGQVRPRLDIVDPEEDATARFARRLHAFQEAFNAFVRAVDDHSPFYPEEIHEELSAAVQIARRELTGVSVVGNDERNATWFAEGAANFRKLVKSADKVSALIRKRFEGLQVHS